MNQFMWTDKKYLEIDRYEQNYGETDQKNIHTPTSTYKYTTNIKIYKHTIINITSYCHILGQCKLSVWDAKYSIFIGQCIYM